VYTGLMEEATHVNKSHNVSLLMYHFVCPAKYRRFVFSEEISKTLKDICMEIEKRYEIWFLEIWTDKDHVHFIIQWVPDNSPKKIIQTVKSLTAREIFKLHPEVKKQLWWWEFWTKWYYVNTVWRYWSEEMIRRYVQNQWQKKSDYKIIHTKKQMNLF